jgi:DNA-binding XRE family transcriptional regulator
MPSATITPTFLMDSSGRRTHAILSYEDWEVLSAMAVPPDDLDLRTIARLEREMIEHPQDFKPAPILNPIRKARLKAGIRQEDLASALGISQPALSKLEQEGHHPRASTVSRAVAAVKAMGK